MMRSASARHNAPQRPRDGGWSLRTYLVARVRRTSVRPPDIPPERRHEGVPKPHEGVRRYADSAALRGYRGAIWVYGRDGLRRFRGLGTVDFVVEKDEGALQKKRQKKCQGCPPKADR